MPAGTGTCCCGTPCGQFAKQSLFYIATTRYLEITVVEFSSAGLFAVFPSGPCETLNERTAICTYISGTTASDDTIIFRRVNDSDGFHCEIHARYSSGSDPFRTYYIHKLSISDDDAEYEIVWNGTDYIKTKGGNCGGTCFFPFTQLTYFHRLQSESEFLATTLTFDVNNTTGGPYSTTVDSSDLVGYGMFGGYVYSYQYAGSGFDIRFNYGASLANAGISYTCPNGATTLLTNYNRDPFSPWADTFYSPYFQCTVPSHCTAGVSNMVVTES